MCSDSTLTNKERFKLTLRKQKFINWLKFPNIEEKFGEDT